MQRRLTGLSASLFTLARVAPLFDVHPSVPGNGWRSLLAVVQSHLTAALGNLERKSGKWWRHLSRDQTPVLVINNLAILVEVSVTKILCNASVGTLFPAANYEGVLSQLLSLPLSVFYGKQFGVQYAKMVRQILGLLLVAMASYGDGVSKSGEGVIGKFRAVMTSTKYLAFNEKAAVRTMELFKDCDVAFLKAFWHLQENVAFVEIDTAIRTPSPAVNGVFRIPVEVLEVPADKSGSSTVTIDIHAMFKEHHELHYDEKNYQQQAGRDSRETSQDGQEGFNPFGKIWNGTDKHMWISGGRAILFDRELSRGLFPDVQVRLLSYNKFAGQKSVAKEKRGLRESTVINTPQRAPSPSKLQRKLGASQRALSPQPSRGDPLRVSSENVGAGGKDAERTGETGRASKNLVIHIHGGGFVAQTSKSHLNYMRDYAKALKCPIVSIDYSLSPEAPFPQALYEAFFAYCWVLCNGESLGTTLDRIVVTGDSAGANLTIAITMLAIKYGVRAPDCIVPVYPALLAKRVPSPARMLSVMDPLLGTGVLLQCLYCYTSGLEAHDPFLSPVLCPDDILEGFPPVHLIAGTLDPLLDDALNFAKALVRNRKTLWLCLLEGLPHGFLGFNRVIPEATKATQKVIAHLRHALDLQGAPGPPVPVGEGHETDSSAEHIIPSTIVVTPSDTPPLHRVSRNDSDGPSASSVLSQPRKKQLALSTSALESGNSSSLSTGSHVDVLRSNTKHGGSWVGGVAKKS